LEQTALERLLAEYSYRVGYGRTGRITRQTAFTGFEKSPEPRSIAPFCDSFAAT
jgi:hypothetical protein